MGVARPPVRTFRIHDSFTPDESYGPVMPETTRLSGDQR
jgi:hypothetical protein